MSSDIFCELIFSDLTRGLQRYIIKCDQNKIPQAIHEGRLLEGIPWLKRNTPTHWWDGCTLMEVSLMPHVDYCDMLGAPDNG